MSQRFTRRATSNRGAALVEYALSLALVAVVLVAAIQLLTTRSERLLDDVSTDISAARPYENVVIETPVDPPPLWATTTIAPGILTWVDRKLETASGRCLQQVGVDLHLVACSAAAAVLLSGLSEDGVVVRISLSDESQCLTGDHLAVPPVVWMQPCGLGGQYWRELTVVGDSVIYELDSTGWCLEELVPAAPLALTLAPCNAAAPGQYLTVDFS